MLFSLSMLQFGEKDQSSGRRKYGIFIMIQVFFTKHGIAVVCQPPYFPYMSSCDFQLILKLKLPLKGSRFGTKEENSQSKVGYLIDRPRMSNFLFFFFRYHQYVCWFAKLFYLFQPCSQFHLAQFNVSLLQLTSPMPTSLPASCQARMPSNVFSSDISPFLITFIGLGICYLLISNTYPLMILQNQSALIC